MNCAWQAYLNLLPLWMRDEVDRVGRHNLQELRMRIHRPPELITGTKKVHLRNTVTNEDLAYSINAVSKFSPWACETISSGYITAAVNFPFTIPTGTQITLSISNTLTGNLRMLFNSGTADIPVNSKKTTMTASVNLTSGRLYLFTTANQAYDLTFRFQIEIGSAASTIEDYKEDTYTISFGSTITDGAEADLLNGLLMINTTPVTYGSFTPIIVRSYKGVNNIVSNVGTSSVTYRETLKHYLDKHNQ